MKSIRGIYKIGRDPSRSHTMGPERACNYFRSVTADADSYKVILYGSLASTGKGHRTDYAIERNAVAAMHAVTALSLANFLTGTRKISFDMVVKTMYETGKDLGYQYRETSKGGLANLF